MSGGLMQLVAYGAQDVYLTGNPQITFWKVVYRRHTSFAMESIEQTFNGVGDWGKKVSATLSRNGDLINRAYLQVTLPSVTVPVHGTANHQNGFRWVEGLGHALIKTVEVEIGGQRIDKHYGHWLHIWNELTQSAGHALGYNNMIGNTPDLFNVTTTTSGGAVAVVPSKTLYIPLQFWFCRNPGLALPLIALQYHEVKINIEFEQLSNLYWAGTRSASSDPWTTSMSTVVPSSLSSASAYVDYIYLDANERRKFAQTSHEFLIEQLQFTGDESTSTTNPKIKMNYNHPCKELIWTVQPNANVAPTVPLGPQWFNFTDDVIDSPWVVSSSQAGAAGGSAFALVNTVYGTGKNPTSVAKIQLNGHDRFSERFGSYFNLVQPYQHHTNIPSQGINVYSFALLPEQHQPSGTCNMSRIDNAVLSLTLTPATVASGPATVRIYCINYNVLRVISGMGGMAYSN